MVSHQDFMGGQRTNESSTKPSIGNEKTWDHQTGKPENHRLKSTLKGEDLYMLVFQEGTNMESSQIVMS